jgi:putative transposase
VKIQGETHYMWRGVDHEGEVLDAFVSKQRDRKSALKFLRKLMKRHGRCEHAVTDTPRSFGAAMKKIGNTDRQMTGRWLNNRTENSHQPFRRRERGMTRFRRLRSLQNFADVHSSVSNHFNWERSLSSRQVFKRNQAVALAEWRGLCLTQKAATLPIARWAIPSPTKHTLQVTGRPSHGCEKQAPAPQ